MTQEETIYPSKPTIEEAESSTSKKLINFALFFGAFYYIFDGDLKFIGLIIFVLLIHEAGHFIAMKIFNYNDVKMFFIPFVGAAVSGKKKNISQKQKIVVLLAGPLPGIIIGSLLLLSGIDNELIHRAASIFIVLNAFNLLPMMPLDGGQIVETLFFMKKKIIQTVFLVISILGFLGVAYYTKSYFLLLLPLFLVFRIVAMYKIDKIQGILKVKQIAYNKNYEELSDEEYWQIRDVVVTNYTVLKDAVVGDYNESPKFEKTIPKHVKNTLTSHVYNNDLGWLGKIGVLVLWILSFIVPLLIYIF